MTVLLNGKKYTLRTTDSDHHVQRVVRYANQRFEDARLVSPRADGETIAAAVALALADELMKAQDDNTRLRGMLLEEHQRTDAKA